MCKLWINYTRTINGNYNSDNSILLFNNWSKYLRTDLYSQEIISMMICEITKILTLIIINILYKLLRM